MSGTFECLSFSTLVHMRVSHIDHDVHNIELECVLIIIVLAKNVWKKVVCVYVCIYEFRIHVGTKAFCVVGNFFNGSSANGMSINT